jgi:hypothetical protein
MIGSFAPGNLHRADQPRRVGFRWKVGRFAAHHALAQA